MERPLEGRVALVTGAGVRVGRAIALRLAAAGADVAVHCHASRAPAEEVAEISRAAGNRAVFLGADLADPAAPAGLVREAEAALGPIDVLVNSAAVFDRQPFLETTLETLERQWAINAR